MHKSLRHLASLALCLLVGTASADTETLASQAAGALAAQDFDTAADVYAKLIESAPEDGRYWFGLGAAQQGLEKYQAAAESYQKSHQMGNQKGVSAFRAARMLGQTGANEKALKWLGVAADDGMLVSTRLVGQMTEFSELRSHASFDAAVARLAPCGSEAHRQFDFWVGEWDVRPVAPPPGQQSPPAFNSISLSEDGCTLIERYKSGPVYTGTSLSFYDRSRDLWHQTWIDNQGSPLYIEGKFEDGKMALWGPKAEGQPRSRVTWQAHADGSVTQHWETTADDGKTWTTAFHGRYTRREQTSD